MNEANAAKERNRNVEFLEILIISFVRSGCILPLQLGTNDALLCKKKRKLPRGNRSLALMMQMYKIKNE